MHDDNPKKGWFQRLKSGLRKSSDRLGQGISDIFVKKKLDESTLEELEDLLISSDLGIEAADRLTKSLSRQKFGKEVSEEEIKTTLAGEITQILTPVAKPLDVSEAHKPNVVLVVGVNGTGKTTTIGKLAKNFKDQGKSVMMVACDTFRAAAIEQLQIWGERTGSEVIAGKQGADAAGLAYDALIRATAENVDVLLIDTAGRLHNKKHLMDELAKIHRVLKKIHESAPHHTILVLDATTGQNAVNQVETFQELVDISGLVLTKLDGTAKGGILVALAEKFGLPVHAVGVGETVEDMKPFSADSYARNLVGLDTADKAA